MNHYYSDMKLKVLENTLNILGCHVYWKDKNGKFIWCNQKLAKVLGLRNSEEIIGKTDYDLYSEELAKKVVEIDRRVIDTKEEYQIEETGLDLNSNLAVYLSIKTPLEDELGNVEGLIGISIDITKQKVAEQAKSAFVMNMAHDIRTPFSGIIGLAQHQARYGLNTPEEIKDYGIMIYQSGNQLLEILDSVMIALDKNDIDEIKQDRINLYEFAQEMQALIKPNIDVNNLQFELKVDKNIEEFITDKIRLKQILANLLSNAVKFTPKGKIILSFELIKSAQLKVEVSDTGIGIDQSNHDRIFGKYEKIKPSYESSTFTGCGVGLYLVKQLLGHLKGTISLKSELGKGATFQIEIPSLSKK